MLSQIIVSRDKDLRSQYAEQICRENSIENFDKTVIVRDETLKQNAKSIGIEEIKNIQKKIFLKPIRSPMKAVIIEDAQLLTVQAQNSLLKVLEEPPDRTILILSADSADVFIPTILSRCKLVLIDKVLQKFGSGLAEEVASFLSSAGRLKTGDVLKLAESRAKSKEGAVEWCECVIFRLRETLLENINEASSGQMNQDLIKKINIFHSLRHQLKNTNINPRFAIENALLSIK